MDVQKKHFTPIAEIPLGQILQERPERAMAFSAARRQIDLTVHGATKNNTDEWVIHITYTGIDKKAYNEVVEPKRTTDGKIFATLYLGYSSRYGDRYRDVYLN